MDVTSTYQEINIIKNKKIHKLLYLQSFEKRQFVKQILWIFIVASSLCHCLNEIDTTTKENFNLILYN